MTRMLSIAAGSLFFQRPQNHPFEGLRQIGRECARWCGRLAAARRADARVRGGLALAF